MFKGSFPAFRFFFIGATCAILSIAVIYYQSQYYHQEPPFPHQWISKVAQNYPEFVIFRTSTIAGAVLLILGWFTNHFLLKTIALEHSFNIKKYLPEIPLIIGTMGGLLLMGNTATIDTGVMNGNIHTFCASRFFILTIIAQVYNTVICVNLYKQTKALSKANLYMKFFVIFLLILQIIDSSIKQYGPFRKENVESDKGKFLEWTLTVTVISMFLSIGYDANQFQFVYTQVSQQHSLQSQQPIRRNMIIS